MNNKQINSNNDNMHLLDTSIAIYRAVTTRSLGKTNVSGGLLPTLFHIKIPTSNFGKHVRHHNS